MGPEVRVAILGSVTELVALHKQQPVSVLQAAKDMLFYATFYGKLEIVQFLFEIGVDVVNTVDERGLTPLHFACWIGWPKLTLYFISEFASLTAYSSAPLYTSKTLCHPDPLSDVNLDNIAALKVTPIHCAIMSKNERLVQFLLMKYGMEAAVVCDSKGRNSLHLAAKYGLSLLVVDLLHLADTCCHRGSTALHYAVENGHTQIVRTLLDLKPSQIGDIDFRGYSCLHIACVGGDCEMVKLLLQYNAAIDAPDTKDRSTPLMAAISSGHLSVTNVLCSLGANVSAHDAAQWTPLHHAARAGRSDILRCLFHHEAEDAAVDMWGNRAVDIARRRQLHGVVDKWIGIKVSGTASGQLELIAHCALHASHDVVRKTQGPRDKEGQGDVTNVINDVDDENNGLDAAEVGAAPLRDFCCSVDDPAVILTEVFRMLICEY